MAEDPKKPQPLHRLRDQDLGTFLPRDGAPRTYKTQGLARLMPKLTRKVAGKRPTLIGDIKIAWPNLVGAEIAGLTRPEKLTAQTLHIDMAAGAGPLVSMQQDQMLARINLHLGAGRVLRLRLRQVDFPLPSHAGDFDGKNCVSAADQALTDDDLGTSGGNSLQAAMARLKERLNTRDHKD